MRRVLAIRGEPRLYRPLLAWSGIRSTADQHHERGVTMTHARSRSILTAVLLAVLTGPAARGAVDADPPRPNVPILDAARQGNVEQLRRHLLWGADLNTADAQRGNAAALRCRQPQHRGCAPPAAPRRDGQCATDQRQGGPRCTTRPSAGRQPSPICCWPNGAEASPADHRGGRAATAPGGRP